MWSGWSAAARSLLRRQRGAPSVPPLPRRRLHSATAPAPKILCLSGEREFPSHLWTSPDDHLINNPIFTRASADRLITSVDSHHPFLKEDKGLFLIRSAILAPYIAHQLGFSLRGTFNEPDNVGVVKEIGIFAFRDIKRSYDLYTGTAVLDYQEVFGFLRALLKRYGLANLPEDVQIFLQAIGNILEEELVYHPSLLPKHLLAWLYFELHRLLVKEFPIRGEKAEANLVIASLLGVGLWERDAVSNPLLLDLMPSYVRDHWLFAVNCALGTPFGVNLLPPTGVKVFPIRRISCKGLVDTHRHGVVHPIEDFRDSLIVTPSLQSVKYSSMEVVTLLDYKFPYYKCSAVTGLNNSSRLKGKLRIKEVFGIPSIFH